MFLRSVGPRVLLSQKDVSNTFKTKSHFHRLFVELKVETLDRKYVPAYELD